MVNIIKFPTHELNLKGIDLTDDQKDRIVLVLQGRAVKNPVQDQITLLRDQITITTNDLGTYTNITTGSVESSIRTALTDLQAALTTFETHTDIVSGVSLSYTGFPPNFLGRLSIANSYNQIKEGMRKTADGVCAVEESKDEIYTDMFHSILGYGENTLKNIELYLVDIESKDENVIQPFLTTSIIDVKAYKTNDNVAFFKAYNFVVKIGLAQALANSKTDDFSNKLFKDVVGTTIFNTDDISALKTQCQVWGDDSSPPPSDFAENFNSEFVLSNVADLVGISIGGATNGDILQFNTYGMMESIPFPSSGGTTQAIGELRCTVDGGGSVVTGITLGTIIEEDFNITGVSLYANVVGSITAAIKRDRSGIITMGTISLSNTQSNRVTDVSGFASTGFVAGDIFLVDWSDGITLGRSTLTVKREINI